MNRFINSEKAPRALGPYSHAVAAGNYIFTSGQVGIDPRTGKLVEGGIVPETEQVLANLRNVLDAAGIGMTDVIKTTVFLVDLTEFPVFNETYEKIFGSHQPARSTVQVTALPAGARVEIEIVAARL